MEKPMIINDELLERLGEYYASEYVTMNRPEIRQVPFHKWVEKELSKREAVRKERNSYWSISA